MEILYSPDDIFNYIKAEMDRLKVHTIIIKGKTNSNLHKIYRHGSKSERLKLASMTTLEHPKCCRIIWLVINKVVIMYTYMVIYLHPITRTIMYRTYLGTIANT